MTSADFHHWLETFLDNLPANAPPEALAMIRAMARTVDKPMATKGTGFPLLCIKDIVYPRDGGSHTPRFTGHCSRASAA